MSKATGTFVARPKRAPCVLICGKCLRKADGGRTLRKALKAGLSDRAAETGARPGKLVETKCLGLCPKGAVTLASGPTLMRGELLVLKGAVDVPAAIETLLR